MMLQTKALTVWRTACTSTAASRKRPNGNRQPKPGQVPGRWDERNQWRDRQDRSLVYPAV